MAHRPTPPRLSYAAGRMATKSKIRSPRGHRNSRAHWQPADKPTAKRCAQTSSVTIYTPLGRGIRPVLTPSRFPVSNGLTPNSTRPQSTSGTPPELWGPVPSCLLSKVHLSYACALNSPGPFQMILMWNGQVRVCDAELLQGPSQNHTQGPTVNHFRHIPWNCAYRYGCR